ncbi:hypothetical protein NQ314_012229 [Rhamnusium bicolor]|uniref:DUF4817 domain-containing protein n=1 Tax=Rhamnusium bicolor TaxID=1586634 RepID=A0AAV8XDW8_9CUCU|nr:hypothetical protein NQ314_012229 [Rhamnusium bicolor]
MPYALGPEHDKFLLEAYFRTGQLDTNNCKWKYSVISCAEQFREQFPDIEQDFDVLSQYVNRLVKRFRETGSLIKGVSTGRPPILMNLRAHVEANPNVTIKELMKQTGFSYGSCQKAKKDIWKKQETIITYALNTLQLKHIFNARENHEDTYRK